MVFTHSDYKVSSATDTIAERKKNIHSFSPLISYICLTIRCLIFNGNTHSDVTCAFFNFSLSRSSFRLFNTWTDHCKIGIYLKKHTSRTFIHTHEQSTQWVTTVNENSKDQIDGNLQTLHVYYNKRFNTINSYTPKPITTILRNVAIEFYVQNIYVA